MPKKATEGSTAGIAADARPLVAALLAGVIYQSRLLNRQAKLNIPEQEVVSDVVSMWHKVMDALAEGK